MKRKIAIMIVLLLTLLTVTGCGNGLEDYKKAVDKTDQIQRGQSSGEFTLNMDFNTEGMSLEDITELNYYKDINGSFQKTFDDKAKQIIARNYLNLGGLGFDFDFYQNGDEMFLKLPIVGKYMKMNDLVKSAGGQSKPEETSQWISEHTIKALSGEWIGLLKKDDVFKGKDVVLTTPDGEVKTKIYTITINDEQFKTLTSNSMDILAKDENLKKNLNTILEKKAGQTTSSEGVDQFFANAKDQLKKDKLERFKYTAYVDIDGYIVNQTLEFNLTRNALTQGEPKEITFKLDLKNWDINKKQKLEFPKLTAENTIINDNSDETMPSLFKGMFNNK